MLTGKIHGQPYNHRGPALKPGQDRRNKHQHGRQRNHDQNSRRHVDRAEDPHGPDPGPGIDAEAHQRRQHTQHGSKGHPRPQSIPESGEEIPGHAVPSAHHPPRHAVVQRGAGRQNGHHRQAAHHPIKADNHHIGGFHHQPDYRVIVLHHAHKVPLYSGVGAITVHAPAFSTAVSQAVRMVTSTALGLKIMEPSTEYSRRR